MISLIAAMDQKRGIGKNGKIPWHIPEDMKRFRELTTGHPVIMGRKTFESIGRPLPDRTNIVITRNPAIAEIGVEVVYSLEEAIKVARDVILNSFQDLKKQSKKMPKQVRHDKKKDEIFVIGGGQIYAQALPLADKLYLTIIEGEYDADTFFPEYEHMGFRIVKKETGEGNGYKYTFLDLER